MEDNGKRIVYIGFTVWIVCYIVFYLVHRG